MTTIQTDLTPEEHEQLLARAKAEGVPVRELVRKVILRFLHPDSVNPNDPIFKVVVDGPADDDAAIEHDQYLYG
jgi:hypothetical protein